MSDFFDGKIVLITGATSGIGFATAMHFASLGSRVVAAARSETDIAARLESGGATEACFIRADVTDGASVAAMVDEVIEMYGQLDFAFNNAGVFAHEPDLHEHSEDIWQQIIAANLSGVYRCMKEEVRAMIAANNPGVIINNASIIGHRGSVSSGAAYTAAKHGVIGLTRQAAIEYASRGIRVNAVSPGPTLTPATRAGLDIPASEAKSRIQALNPTGDLVPIETIAETVAFLCTPAARLINGHDVPLDGGQLAKL